MRLAHISDAPAFTHTHACTHAHTHARTHTRAHTHTHTHTHTLPILPILHTRHSCYTKVGASIIDKDQDRGGDTSGIWEMGSAVAIDMVDMPFFFFTSMGSLTFVFTPGFVLIGAKFSQWSHRNKLKSDLADDDKDGKKKIYEDTPFKNYVNGDNANKSPHYVEIVRKLTPTLMFMLWVGISLWIAWSRLSLLGESIGDFAVMDIAFGVAPPFKVPSLQMPIAVFSFSYGALRFSGLMQRLVKQAVDAWIRAKKIAKAAKALETPSATSTKKITPVSASGGAGSNAGNAAADKVREDLKKRASNAAIDLGDKIGKDLEGGSGSADDSGDNATKKEEEEEEEELKPDELRRWGK
jgi:hypothetical protein